MALSARLDAARRLEPGPWRDGEGTRVKIWIPVHAGFSFVDCAAEAPGSGKPSIQETQDRDEYCGAPERRVSLTGGAAPEPATALWCCVLSRVCADAAAQGLFDPQHVGGDRAGAQARRTGDFLDAMAFAEPEPRHFLTARIGNAFDG